MMGGKKKTQNERPERQGAISVSKLLRENWQGEMEERGCLERKKKKEIKKKIKGDSLMKGFSVKLTSASLKTRRHNKSVQPGTF